MNRGKTILKIAILIALVAAPLAAWRWYDETIAWIFLFAFFLILAAFLDSWVIFWITMTSFISLSHGFVWASLRGRRGDSLLPALINWAVFGVITGIILGAVSNTIRSAIRELRKESKPERDAIEKKYLQIYKSTGNK